MNDIAILIDKTYVIDETTGDNMSSQTERMVFCDSSSVSQSEFHAAAQTGRRPALRLKMWASEYRDEEYAVYNDAEYYIYRTFKTKDLIELYLERRLNDE